MVKSNQLKSILVVDDEPAVLSVVGAALRREGYKVICAGSPAEAIRLCESGSTPDILLADGLMPEMNARPLADRLGQRLPNLAVVFMSGWDRPTLEALGAIRRDDDFLEKPFRPSLLRRAIAQALARASTPARDSKSQASFADLL